LQCLVLIATLDMGNGWQKEWLVRATPTHNFEVPSINLSPVNFHYNILYQTMTLLTFEIRKHLSATFTFLEYKKHQERCSIPCQGLILRVVLSFTSGQCAQLNNYYLAHIHVCYIDIFMVL